MADTNPLRENLADPSDNIGRGLDLDVYSTLCHYLDVNTASYATGAVMAVLAEFIGDGLLDANGQRWTKREVEPTIDYRWGESFLEIEDAQTYEVLYATGERPPLFVLERSETDA